MRVVVVPCLSDNFAYLVIDDATHLAAVVDPGEAAPVEVALTSEGVTLAAIWATHHHRDHVGGTAALVAAHPGIAVVAGERDADRIEHVTGMSIERLGDGATTQLGTLTATAIHNPGHTLGAISFHVEDAVFTGDTLFAAGCGRLFEGDAAMMHASLQRLAALPPETRVYFGHEYTAANLRFAAAAEPGNADVAGRAQALPSPSTPSTIAIERATNPFLRAADAAAFADLRKRKDTFR